MWERKRTHKKAIVRAQIVRWKMLLNQMHSLAHSCLAHKTLQSHCGWAFKISFRNWLNQRERAREKEESAQLQCIGQCTVTGGYCVASYQPCRDCGIRVLFDFDWMRLMRVWIVFPCLVLCTVHTHTHAEYVQCARNSRECSNRQCSPSERMS